MTPTPKHICLPLEWSTWGDRQTAHFSDCKTSITRKITHTPLTPPGGKTFFVVNKRQSFCTLINWMMFCKIKLFFTVGSFWTCLVFDSIFLLAFVFMKAFLGWQFIVVLIIYPAFGANMNLQTWGLSRYFTKQFLINVVRDSLRWDETPAVLKDDIFLSYRLEKDIEKMSVLRNLNIHVNCYLLLCHKVKKLISGETIVSKI